MMHRLDERAPEAWNPSQEFIEKMGAFIQDSIDKGILITAEGVHPSEKGALVRKSRNAVLTGTAAKLPPVNPPAYQQTLSKIGKALHADPSAAREAIDDRPLTTLLDAMHPL
jgi:hypothetical protein